jgi:hypothetical protein
MSTPDEITSFNQALRLYGANTLHLLLSAMLIWLFGVLVFIPLASSIGWNAELVCTLIVLVAFTLLVSRAISGFKILIDAFSVFPARKYLIKRGLAKDNAVVASKQILYMLSIVILYLLYFPFLVRLHPAFSGIILVLVLILVFFLALKTLRASQRAITDWLYS